MKAVITEELEKMALSCLEARYDARYGIGTYKKETRRYNIVRKAWGKLNPKIKNGHPEYFPNWMFEIQRKFKDEGYRV